jgi:hypothetical protein
MLWNHLAAREIRALESRLRRQEEAYRLAQSPRVTAALDLWGAFCRFERALERSLVPSPSTYDVLTPRDLERVPGREALVREAVEEMREAWVGLSAARDRAEVLVPAPAFRAFEDAFQAYNMVYDERWAARMGSGEGRRDPPPGLLAEAKRLRARALEALQALVGAGDPPPRQARAKPPEST